MNIKGSLTDDDRAKIRRMNDFGTPELEVALWCGKPWLPTRVVRHDGSPLSVTEANRVQAHVGINRCVP